MKILTYLKLAAFASFCLFCACNQQNTADGSPIVAQANAHTLTLAQLKRNIPEHLSGEDSTTFASNYIDAWIKNQLLYDKAILNLAEEQQGIDEKVNSFKQSLYIHKYEQQLINHNLSKEVEPSAIESYYNSHKAEFLLRNDIVKSNYIKIDKEAGNDKKIRTWINSTKEEDLDKLKDFGFQFATKFSFSEEWLDAEFVLRQMPHKIYNQQGVLKYKQLATNSDSLYNYFLLITDYKAKEDTAPIDYVRTTIEEILLQQRKKALITETRNKIFEEAIGKNTAQIHKIK